MPHTLARTVIKQFAIALLTTGFLLTGCAYRPSATVTTIAWDGLGQDPNRRLAKKHVEGGILKQQPSPNTERNKTLATLRPYSDAWWIVHDEIEAENDRQLTSKLAICRGCITVDNDTTGSVR